MIGGHGTFVMFYFSNGILNLVCYFQRGIWVVGYNTQGNGIRKLVDNLNCESCFSHITLY